jgi:hypothetical protein
MKIKDKAIEAIHDLPLQDTMKIYEMILMLRNKNQYDNECTRGKKKEDTYQRAQEILKICPGSFSDDISAERVERI